MKATNCKVPNFGQTTKPNFAFCPPLNLHLNASLFIICFFRIILLFSKNCESWCLCVHENELRGARILHNFVCLVELDLATFHFSQNVFFFRSCYCCCSEEEKNNLQFKYGRKKGDSLFPFLNNKHKQI